MRKLLISSLFLLVIINTAMAQDTCRKITFQRAYLISRYNGPYEIMQTKDSGYLITGTQSDELSGNGDGLLLKTNKYGEKQWVNAYNRTADEWPYLDGDYPFFSSAQLADSSYLSVAYTGSPQTGLQKTDKNGNLVWQKKFGLADWNVSFEKIVSAPGNTAIITGHYSNAFFPENGGSLIIRIDEDGNIIWQKALHSGLPNYPIAAFIKEDTILVNGVLPSSEAPASDSVYIMKMALATGQIYQSKKIWLGENHSLGLNSFIKRTDHKYVLSISYNDMFTGDVTNLILGLDQNFNLIQSDKLINIEPGAAYLIKPSHDNGFVMTYDLFSNATSCFIKFDQTHTPQFGKFYTPLYKDDAFYYIYSIGQTNDSGYVISAGKYFADSSLLFVFKTDALGNTGDCPVTNIPTPAIENIAINNEFFVWQSEIDPGLSELPLAVPVSTPNYFDSTLCSNSTCDQSCTIYAPNGKIYLCHVPPGGGTPEQLILPLSGVNHHLSTHPEDRVGLCEHPCSGFTLESNTSNSTALERLNNTSHQTIIYPNPSSGSFTIRFAETTLSPVLVTVFSADGKVAYKASSQGTRKINFGDKLSSGIYYVELRNQNKKEVFKIVKLK